MEPIKFRDIEKEQLRARVPRKLEERIRREAFEQKKSLSAVLTTYLAQAMNEDPQNFGLCANGGIVPTP